MQQAGSESSRFGATSSSSSSGCSNKVDFGPDGKPRRTRDNYTFPAHEIDRIERENQQVNHNPDFRMMACKAARIVCPLLIV